MGSLDAGAASEDIRSLGRYAHKSSTKEKDGPPATVEAGSALHGRELWPCHRLPGDAGRPGRPWRQPVTIAGTGRQGCVRAELTERRGPVAQGRPGKLLVRTIYQGAKFWLT